MSEVLVAASRDDRQAYLKLSGRVTLEQGDVLKDSGLLLLDNEAAQLKLELISCEFMDSTIMGVITLLALECHKRGHKLELLNCSPTVKNLLVGLGVDRVTAFINEDTTGLNWNKTSLLKACNLNSGLILDAHKALTEIDEANVSRFEHVISCLESDLDEKM